MYYLISVIELHSWGWSWRDAVAMTNRIYREKRRRI
jgi:hypothetical protein